ncbi:TPA: hypothetical protein NJ548_004447 [Vibrio parahaemolyticus]|uniref:HNH endonuclease n=1 Tax=Vibrio TaxID=662 RepID=UPI00193CF7F7|nr:HNH endonuclease [Vibrio parahaemolyticus]BDP35058.1 hypothetical protein VA208B3_14290 [Vibrio alginolyticus]MBM5001057.1 hypothetical protein [Vibrio parahaemolyticus]MCR9694153.1 HNH endonuclease [Vibrio parahaemolyticus]MCR9760577.1 HNH endonuclease [Vibrio parahaemolyticus]MDF4936142.1 HNH endonuclease [Vibrio parahaemolyticus]
MDFNESGKFFSDNYKSILDENKLGSGSKVLIGKKGDDCRFCGKNKPETDFRTIAHAVPEFLGNKRFILLTECDQCNEYFSNNLEVHLDKYTRPYRLLAKIKGKRKTPSYKSKDKKTRHNSNNKGPDHINSPSDSGFFKFDEENKIVTQIFEIESYIPSAVYKCLVKIALSVIPDSEVENFKDTIKWINTKDHSIGYINPLHVYQAFIPGFKPINESFVDVLKKQDLVSTFPAYWLIIGFGNIVYQIIIPSSLNSSIKFRELFFPLPFDFDWPFGSVIRSTEDLTSHELVEGRKLPIQSSFDKLEMKEEYIGKSFSELGIKYP